MKTETLGPPTLGGSRTRPPRPREEPAEPETKTQPKTQKRRGARKDGE